MTTTELSFELTKQELVWLAEKVYAAGGNSVLNLTEKKAIHNDVIFKNIQALELKIREEKAKILI